MERAGTASIRQLRRAFVTSVVSLVLCCVMLLGTTYAWLTKKDSSGIQRIQSGSLDVELRYRRNLEDSWTRISAESEIGDLFRDKIWKPGDVEYVLLEVTNTGSLPVSYQLLVSEETAVEPEVAAATPAVAEPEVQEIEYLEESEGVLDWLEVGCIYGKWYEAEEYKTESPSNAQMIELAQMDGANSSVAEGYSALGTMEAGDEVKEIVTLVIYRAEEAEQYLIAEPDGEEAGERAEFHIAFRAEQQSPESLEEAGES